MASDEKGAPVCPFIKYALYCYWCNLEMGWCIGSESGKEGSQESSWGKLLTHIASPTDSVRSVALGNRSFRHLNVFMPSQLGNVVTKNRERCDKVFDPKAVTVVNTSLEFYVQTRLLHSSQAIQFLYTLVSPPFDLPIRQRPVEAPP